MIWLSEPAEHDFAAAEDYLSLIMRPPEAHLIRLLLARTENAETQLIKRKAKDILRASALPLLPVTNKHVARDLKKAANGEPLSPILCVRGDNSPLIVADGYHRVCCAYWVAEDTPIPMVIV